MENQPETPQQTPIVPVNEIAPLTSPPQSKLPLILLVLLLLFLFGTGGLILGKYLYSPQTMTSTPPPAGRQTTLTTKPTVIPTVTPDQTVYTEGTRSANWKTYTNDSYGLSIKYPPHFTILSSNDSKIFGNYAVFFLSSEKERTDLENCFIKAEQTDCNNYSLGLQFDKKTKNPKTTLEDYIKRDIKEDITQYTKTTIAGYPAFQKQTEGIGMVHNLYVDHGQFVLHVFANAVINERINIETYKQMLNTFKFLDQNITTSLPVKKATTLIYKLPPGWKTISDETGTFEVGYNPNDTYTNLSYIKGKISLTVNKDYRPFLNVGLFEYDGSSRHNFIFKNMGQPQIKGDSPEEYREVEYMYEGRSCLFLENIFISQMPFIWGMCDAGNRKAFLVTSYTSDYQQILTTIRLIK